MKRFSVLLLIISLLLGCVNANALYEDGERIYSRCAYMVHIETGRVVVDKNASAIVFPASLTKILTVITALELCDRPQQETVKIPPGIFTDVYNQGGAHISLKAGEEISLKDLLYATMLISACDAASAVAYHLGDGSIEAFVEQMNALAHRIGADETYCKNAHGLHEEGHVTTARDVYLITSYALENEAFREIIGAQSYTIPETNLSKERKISYTISMLDQASESYYPFMTGIKSGFTSEAGRCLVTMAKKNGMSYLLVLLGANLDQPVMSASYGNMAYEDAVNLFEYCFKEYSYESILKKGDILGSVKVEYGTEDSVDVIAASDIFALVGGTEDPRISLSLPPSIEAPVADGGEVPGSATVTLGGTEIGTVPVLTAKQVARAADAPRLPGEAEDARPSFFSLLLRLLIAAAAAFFCFVLLLFAALRLRKKKRRARRKK